MDKILLSNGLYLIKDPDNVFSSGWKFSGGYGGNYTMDWLQQMYGNEKAKELYEDQKSEKLRLIKDHLNENS